jgi:hypothetical protein
MRYQVLFDNLNIHVPLALAAIEVIAPFSVCPVLGNWDSDVISIAERTVTDWLSTGVDGIVTVPDAIVIGDSNTK